MRRFFGSIGLLAFALIVVLEGRLALGRPVAMLTTYRLDSTKGLELVNTDAQVMNYRGRRALHLTAPPGGEKDKGSMIALVNGTDFRNGTIEVEVAGLPIAAMDSTARGFIGVVFRAQQHGTKAENFYLRPTNGRADDQLRRNHSVQYEALPDFPWDRLRREQPGVYESYADLEAGVWANMKIEVAGTKAKLYVNGAEQPCLIVNDLKLGDSRGQIGLWAFVATDAYFSNLKVTRAD
jgi:hypothetical protein